MEKREIDKTIVSKIKNEGSGGSSSIDTMHQNLKKIGDGREIPVKNRGVYALDPIEYNKK